jgi:D-serine deaminase-like pyridoxal phosphate-dependent protein
MNWYEIKNIGEVDSPCLVVYPERVKENIRLLKSMIDDVNRLRPHVKTNKSPDATKLMLEAGINKFKCATIAEAEMLADAGAKDILLAYQPVGPKLQRFIALITARPGIIFSCITDNITAARSMSAAFADSGLSIPVYIDLNTGMNRTGISPGQAAVELYTACASLKGIKPVGLHAYDGHIRHSDFEKRKQQCDTVFAEVEKTRDSIVTAGFHEPVIVAGGSPSFSIHCKRPKLVCSPGTFIYWDKGYQDLCEEQPFLPAALVISRVISLPSAGKICVDLGHKSIAAENDLLHRVFFLNAPDLKPVGQSEEHLVLEAGNDHQYQPGDILYGIPMHVCPTVALYERALTVTDHIQNGEWKNIARDRKISF